MKKTIHHFTLIELLVAMAILTIFMLSMMQFFSSTQTLMTGSSDRTEMYERARIVMDLIANDLQCAYYVEDTPKMYPLYLARKSENLDTKNIEQPVHKDLLWVLTKRASKRVVDGTEVKMTHTAVKYETGVSHLDPDNDSTTAYPYMVLRTLSYDNYDLDSDQKTFPLLEPYLEANAENSFKNRTPGGVHSVMIADGVVSFSVSFVDNAGNIVSSPFPSGNTTIPALAQIEITLIPQNVMEKLKTMNVSPTTKMKETMKNLVNESKRSFVRTVCLDRGQFN